MLDVNNLVEVEAKIYFQLHKDCIPEVGNEKYMRKLLEDNLCMVFSKDPNIKNIKLEIRTIQTKG